MKAITLLQPWASLIAEGAKRFETRSWGTKYRGPIAIHSSKRILTNDTLLLDREPFKSALNDRPARDLPLGRIIATANLVDVRPTEKVLEELLAADDIAEVAFGNYGPGRFAWVLEHVAQLPEPIQCNGRLYLWDTLAFPAIARAEAQLFDVSELGGERCLYCGCTEHVACAGGCSWISHDPPTCSACGPAGARRLAA